MLSLGIEASLAFCTARPRAALVFGSPPPSFAATVIARASFVRSLPRRASTIAFLCLIPAHLECPAMTASLLPPVTATAAQTRQTHFPLFDGLRGLAATAVFMVHAAYQFAVTRPGEHEWYRFAIQI